MSDNRIRLQSLVDALPETEALVAISFLSELGGQEIVDAETAAKLDLARTEPGDDIPLDTMLMRGTWRTKISRTCWRKPPT